MKSLLKTLFAITLFITSIMNAHTTMNQNLNNKETAIIRIASTTSKGDLLKLKEELNAGLDSGLTINEVKEVIVHLYAYCGFPRSIRGLQTFMTVLEERKAKGIIDSVGKEASPIKEETSKYERGQNVLAKLTGTKQDGPKTGYSAFSPEIDQFLKEHLFAAIFERDVLTYAERELVTISVLAAIGDVEPMLKSHLNICMNVGLKPSQLQEFIIVIEKTIGTKESTEAQKVLDEVLKTKSKF
ncbi:alkylhydroperoxidase/carboxymuconolactone decarboxylase family protein YurZ [Flavobacterium sp. HSC-32F16]|uniref:carboxymuconolactone decarboxylase family protein n=1 Tax=Flavobacterium sp. HSC-32F16 TaxID=2910964 RepID=UPI0020A4A0ED|nr:carboxymuconolactone decarboxylase family protein [Flavobacterium sp. HSC-32F16]MCP2025227.1 alkylhydroperoxidase/carboxymuconolactone decarboxylase family protein YurZ [Flavobacterium sp. HSC-32F16]